jgi:hypothetical protein
VAAATVVVVIAIALPLSAQSMLAPTVYGQGPEIHLLPDCGLEGGNLRTGLLARNPSLDPVGRQKCRVSADVGQGDGVGARRLSREVQSLVCARLAPLRGFFTDSTVRGFKTRSAWFLSARL